MESIDFSLREDEGFKGFYTGYKLMIIRSFIVNGFVLTAYDVFRDHFNLND